VRGDELFDRAETAAAELASHRVSPRRIGVNYSNEPYCHTLVGELMVDASVVSAKRAHANHRNVGEVVSSQLSVLKWLVAGRPVDLITKARQRLSGIDAR